MSEDKFIYDVTYVYVPDQREKTTVQGVAKSPAQMLELAEAWLRNEDQQDHRILGVIETGKVTISDDPDKDH